MGMGQIINPGQRGILGISDRPDGSLPVWVEPLRMRGKDYQ